MNFDGPTKKDALDALAAGILRDCAKTIGKMRPLAKTAEWTVDEVFDRIIELHIEAARKHE